MKKKRKASPTSRSNMAIRAAGGARNSLDAYPGKYGPQDIRRNFEKNMERRCKGK